MTKAVVANEIGRVQADNVYLSAASIYASRKTTRRSVTVKRQL